MLLLEKEKKRKILNINEPLKTLANLLAKHLLKNSSVIRFEYSSFSRSGFISENFLTSFTTKPPDMAMQVVTGPSCPVSRWSVKTRSQTYCN